jgi:endonuclease/exonuclease/phosphatase family metal-dependent hydrolase
MNRIILIWGFVLFIIPFLWSQKSLPDGFDGSPRGAKGLRVMFYNVENLFDTKDDTLKQDGEFLPDGGRRWSDYKFWKKVNNLSSVIVSVGGWEPPAVVALCEVENRNALKALFYGSGLKKFDYEIVHHESPDVRGIDVALAYQSKKLTLLHSKAFPVDLGELSSRPTRDILYVKMKTLSQDTLHFLINHWPSRWGGEEATRPKRNRAAKHLKAITDSLKILPNEQNMIIMGDFNDGPENESIKKVLHAQDSTSGTYLVNLMSPYLKQKNTGTHFYREETGPEWHLLDQIIVSRPLIQQDNIHIRNKAMIFDAPFLLTEEKGVTRTFRTFQGYKFIGGYSDHLPVYLDIFVK